jgi:hypothetical protein
LDGQNKKKFMNFFFQEGKKEENIDLESQDHKVTIVDSFNLNGVFEISRTQKFYGFIITFCLGLFSIFLSTLFLPTILITSRKFAFLYSVGNLLLLFRYFFF